MGEDVLFSRQGGVGRIVLNRPKALNALTLSMIEDLHRHLDRWERSTGTALTLESSSPRAFCAGGDIRQIRQNSVEGRHERSTAFFSAEYELNARLSELNTPVVSLIDGICMGGGLGLSVHGSFRVVSDRATLAMPETAIGFFPDVGASYFLPRLPGAIGTYLALTGRRLDSTDAIYTGLATHRVADLSTVVNALARHDDAVDEVLRGQATEPGPATHDGVAQRRDDIDWCFGAPTVTEVASRLTGLSTSWATETLRSLQSASPQSLEITMNAQRWGKQLSLRRCLSMELDIATAIIATHDFTEGVRAALVDKDREPSWRAVPEYEFRSTASGSGDGLIQSIPDPHTR